MRVLIVEDVQSMRQVIKKIVQSLGIKTIDETGDGFKAMNYLKNRKYDLVITDWLLPNISGIELVEYIKKSKDINSTLVMMLTSQSSKENISEAVKFGVNGYLVKPISPIKFKDQILKVLKNRKKTGKKTSIS